MEVAYLDPRSGAQFPLAAPLWRAPSGAPLLLTPMPGIGRADIDRGARGPWRYAAALPFRPHDPISLGEGSTPLLARRFFGAKAFVKCEWMMPTGSFKDRGAAVMLSLLRQQGIEAVLEDSSGNGGAAIAAYAAAGGMAATIMAPASTSPAKTVAMRAAGATVELVPGSRQDTADAAVARAETIFYASHNWHPFFLHGTKTLAYELWEDLDYSVPDNILVPCGAGSNVLGCAIGFAELMRAGMISRLPRIFAVQPQNCGPIAAAFAAGAQDAVPVAIAPTIAEGTAIAQPVRMKEVLAALRGSGGGAVTISEDRIAAAALALAGAGLYVEPTCAQVLAGFEDLLQAGTIAPEQTSVLVLTGAGAKATPRFAEILGIAL